MTARYLLVAIALGGCYSGYIDANLHPSVAPQMANVPVERRDQVFDSATALPPPEQHGDRTPKERKLETAAAIGAVLIGDYFSYSHNVLLGLGTGFDETGHIATQSAPASTPANRLVFDPTKFELVPPAAPPPSDDAQ